MNNQSLEIRSWSRLTWSLVSVWCLLTIWGNSPLGQAHPAQSRAQFDLRGYLFQSARSVSPDYEYTALLGWPLTYLHIDHPTYSISHFNLLLAVASIAIALLTIASIVYISQKFLSQFSLRQTGLLVFALASICGIGGYVIPDWGLVTFIYTMFGIYILPLAIGVVLWISSELKMRRTKAQQENLRQLAT